MKIKIVNRFDGGSLFAGANSAGGFVSFYDSILEDSSIERIYILKGGPGTGKSRFMKDAAERGERLGLCVERYSCSSDPESLDGVVIGKRCAILDGTAPHTVEASLAGARDELIDLGRFWDAEKLAVRRDEIEKLSEGKRECYKKAYRYLEACANVRDIKEKLARAYFLEDKASRSVKRVFSDIKRGGGYELSHGIICSVGMKGRVRYDTYERFADKIYIIDDFYGFGHLYLSMLVEMARESDTPIRISYDPVDCKRLDAVFFENDRRAFVIDRGREALSGDTHINMKRFADVVGIAEIRSEYRFDRKLEDALLDSALDALADAGKYHFGLEEIYTSCMDFEAKEVFCNNFLDNLFNERA